MSHFVSVVMPLYNKERSVLRAVRSVLAQTKGDLELLVINDGSTDGSEGVVRAITDSRIRIINQPNSGVSVARNRGIAEARGSFVAFLDSDDEWLPTFLETVLALVERFPSAGAYSTAFLSCTDGRVSAYPQSGVAGCLDGELIPNYFRSCTLGSNMVCSSSVLIPRRIFDEVGLFPTAVPNGEDLHMWARIALRFPIAWSPLVGAIWHRSAENRNAGRVVMPDCPFAPLLEEAMAQRRLEPEVATWIRAYLTHFRLHYAQVAINLGDRRTCWRLLWRARGTRVFRKQVIKAALRSIIPDAVLRLKRRLVACMR